MSADVLLKVEDLHAHYGKSHVLRGVTLEVRRGEVVSLLGRNGSGRSTTLKAMMGLVPPSAGRVQLGADAQRAAAEAPHDAHLALHPGVVVGRRAGERGVEGLLVAVADVDRHRVSGHACGLDQPAAERPGVVEVEGVEAQPLLLLAQDRQPPFVLGAHGATP